jgi:hypothetical protein
VWLKDQLKICKLLFRVPTLCHKNNIDIFKTAFLEQKAAK